MYLVEICLQTPRLAEQKREPGKEAQGQQTVKPFFTSKDMAIPSTGTSSGGNSRSSVTWARGLVTWQASRTG